MAALPVRLATATFVAVAFRARFTGPIAIRGALGGPQRARGATSAPSPLSVHPASVRTPVPRPRGLSAVGMSDRAIAAKIGVGHQTVKRARQKSTATNVSVGKRAGKDGKARRLPVHSTVRRARRKATAEKSAVAKRTGKDGKRPPPRPAMMLPRCARIVHQNAHQISVIVAAQNTA